MHNCDEFNEDRNKEGMRLTIIAIISSTEVEKEVPEKAQLLLVCYRNFLPYANIGNTTVLLVHRDSDHRIDFIL